MAAVKENSLQEKRIKTLGNRYWRLNHLYYILDKQGNHVLFRMNPVQYALYFALHFLNIIPKSRQHGMTTFISLFMLDACLFNSNTAAGIVAHKLKDAQKIFRKKVKYAYMHLPKDLRDAITLTKDGAEELEFSNGSSFYVGTSMRSGTLQYLHISEYGYLCTHAPQKAAEIKAGAMETVHEDGMIFIESTFEGPTGDFPEMCEAAETLRVNGKELGPLDYKIHFFAWWQDKSNTTDPRYVEISPEMHAYFDKLEQICGMELTEGQRAWYTAKKRNLGSLIYKEHPSTLEEAQLVKVVGSYYGETFSWLHEQGRIGEVPHNPAYPVYVICDPGYTSAWWLIQLMPTGYVHFLRYYEDTGKDFAHYATMLQRWSDAYGYRYGGKYAPFDVDNNQYKLVDSDGLLEVARRAGVDFEDPMEVEKDVQLGIVKVNQMLKMARFDEEGCKVGIKKCKAYHEAINTSMSTEDKPVFTGIPAKDGNDHAADGLRYVRKAIPLIEGVGDSSTNHQDYQNFKRMYA
jgi:hypothetical protein